MCDIFEVSNCICDNKDGKTSARVFARLEGCQGHYLLGGPDNLRLDRSLFTHYMSSGYEDQEG